MSGSKEVSLQEVAVAEHGQKPAAHAPPAAQKPGASGEYTCDEHLLSIEELAKKHGTELNYDEPQKSRGISTAEAEKRLKEFGPNAMSPPKGLPEWVKLLLKFTDKFMVLLVCAGILCHVAYGLDKTQALNLYLGIILYGIVIITCVTTYLQERQTAGVMDAIKGMLASSCTVIRGGAEMRVDPKLLVPGDIVRLGLGDRVPADMRIIYTADLKTEQSSLTGEPDAIAATVKAQHELPIEARNIVFSSSLVHNGEGFGVVMRTGDNTMIGSIAALASSGHTDETLLQKEIHRFVNFIGILAIVTAFIFFGIGMGRKQPVISTFVNGFIVVIVANIPEGLPATVTSCLSITAKRMASRNVLIKRTDIIESLGSASVIASDKTGTLTQNKMTVENMWYNRTVFNAYAGARPDLLEMMQATATHEAGREGGPPVSFRDKPQMVEGGSYGDKNSITTFERTNFTVSAFASFAKISWDRFSPHAKLLTIAGVCNRARYEDTAPAAPGDDKTRSKLTTTMEAGERKILGDASDSGLLRYCDKMFPVAIARANFPKQFEVPFNSVNKFAITVVADPGNSKQNIVFMKGAPEIILSRCSDYMYNSRTRPIDEDFKEEWQSAYERFGSMGERVLGFAYLVIPAHKAEEYAADKDGELVPTKGLCFCGLISLVDPPRPGVAEAIMTCRKAGIRVTMVTGDHPLTAEAIARKVNIITLPTRRDVAMEEGVPEAQIAISDERVGAMVVTGSQVNDLTQKDWDDILSKKEVVFARTSPQQKLKLVENYQRRGEVVAVTGDGVNDSPALKRAQIGVAMGSENASDVAREAADIILMDDNFASIVGAIEEGRTLFDNLKKTIAYTLAHLWPELIPVFLNLAFSFPLGLNGLMILTIDLLTEQGPAISLAFEGPEAAVMERKPRNVKTDRLVSAPSLFYAYFTAGLTNAITCMWCYFMVFTSKKIQVRHIAFSVPFYFNIPESKKSPADIFSYKEAADGNPAWWMFLCNGDRRDDLAQTLAWNFGFEYKYHDAAAMGLPVADPAVMPPPELVSSLILNTLPLNGTSYVTSLLPYTGNNFATALKASGCVVFSPQDQWKVYSESLCAWYLTLIMCQFWHIWACRTRIVSLFQQGVLSNIVTIYGAVTAIGIMVGVIYIPVFHTADAFQTTQLRGWFWLPHIAYGIYILTYNEAVKWFVRNRPHGFVAQKLAW